SLLLRRPPSPPLFPYTTLFRSLLIERLTPLLPVQSCIVVVQGYHGHDLVLVEPSHLLVAVQPELARRQLALKRQAASGIPLQQPDRKSTRLNSNHVKISYAVFC